MEYSFLKINCFHQEKEPQPGGSGGSAGVSVRKAAAARGSALLLLMLGDPLVFVSQSLGLT